MKPKTFSQRLGRALALAASVLAGVPSLYAAAPVSPDVPPVCYLRQDLNARASGFLTKVLASEGQQVKAGDTLAELDNRQLLAATREAKAAVAVAAANLDLARDTQRRLVKLSGTVAPQELFDADIHVRQAAGQLEQAKGALDRVRAQLDDTRIKAEIDGRVSGLPQVKGLYVQAGQSLGRVEAPPARCAASH